MKKAEIKVGGLYKLNIGRKPCTVRVKEITEQKPSPDERMVTYYRCVVESSEQEVVVKTAQRFLEEIVETSPEGWDAFISHMEDMGNDPDDFTMSQLNDRYEEWKAEQNRATAPAVETVPVTLQPEPVFMTTAESWRYQQDKAYQNMVELNKETEKLIESEGGVKTSVIHDSTTYDVPADKVRTLSQKLTEKLKGSTDTAPHLVIVARAGTGKTTTLVEGLKYMKGIPTTITPSEQQQAIWDELAKSKNARSVCFVAFNKSIATELQERVPAGCDAMTMHSMGYKAVTAALGRQEPNNYVVMDHIGEIMGVDSKDLMRERPALVSGTEQLVALCKQNLLEPTEENLTHLVNHYDVELNGDKKDAFELVPKVLKKCLEPKGRINFDDMIWLPVALNLPVRQYDLLLVDEAQDLNRCQQSLAKKAGKRLVFCGDEKQAIYGFAGADCDSIPRMIRELGEEDNRGCVVLPLTVTRRCGKRIVEEARTIVPDFEAHESNPEGKISHAKYTKDTDGRTRSLEATYVPLVQEGNMVLCRVNAPLVSQCLRFLQMGKKASIQGRDIGANLTNLVRKVCGVKSRETPFTPVDQLTSLLYDWADKEISKEQAKKVPSETKLVIIQDKVDCILCFTDGATTAADVIRKIEEVFTDDKTKPGIRLSSIHKAKGLEADRVFFLRPKDGPCPHPMAKSAWEQEQESNLCYVAITRAKQELVYVTS